MSGMRMRTAIRNCFTRLASRLAKGLDSGKVWDGQRIQATNAQRLAVCS